VKFDDAMQAQVRVGIHIVAALTVGNEKNCKLRGQLEFFVEFIPKNLLSEGQQDVSVPGVYFKNYSGNEVQLHVNSDDGIGMAPEV
jgi:hypothetical protein